MCFQVQLSPGLCPDFSEVPEQLTPEIDAYGNIRVSQVYGLLNAAMASATASPNGKAIVCEFFESRVFLMWATR